MENIKVKDKYKKVVLGAQGPAKEMNRIDVTA
jgi:hypothetical protein